MSRSPVGGCLLAFVVATAMGCTAPVAADAGADEDLNDAGTVDAGGPDAGTTTVDAGPACTTLTGWHRVTNRADLDSLVERGGACFRIDGDLEISSTTLISLAGLEALTAVEGELSIGPTSALTDASALDEIERIGTLRVSRNASLVELPPFSALTTLDGLVLSENASLASLVGFDGVVSTSTVLIGGPALTHISAFAGLERVSHGLDLCAFGQTPLVSVSLAPALRSARFIKVCSALGLTAWNDYPDLASLDSLEVSRTALPALFAIGSVSRLDGGLTLVNNAALSDISALAGLTAIEGLYLRGNGLLVDVTPLADVAIDHTFILQDSAIVEGTFRLRDAWWTFMVEDNVALTSLSFPVLTDVQWLQVVRNPALTTLRLPLLRTGGTHDIFIPTSPMFIIRDNPSLVGLELPTLERTEGSFSVAECPTMSRLEAPRLATVGSFTVQGTSVPRCELEGLVADIEARGTITGTVQIDGNDDDALCGDGGTPDAG